MRTPIRIVLALLVAATGFAQTATPPPPFTSVPRVEDVDLYDAFFNYQQGMITSMTTAIAADPTRSATLNQQMATTLGISVGELPVVIANMQQVTQNYAQLTSDSLAGNLTLPQGAPAPTAAQLASAFKFKRVRLTTGAVVALFQQLSPASWGGLHIYIVGPYKATIYQH